MEPAAAAERTEREVPGYRNLHHFLHFNEVSINKIVSETLNENGENKRFDLELHTTIQGVFNYSKVF